MTPPSPRQSSDARKRQVDYINSLPDEPIINAAVVTEETLLEGEVERTDTTQKLNNIKGKPVNMNYSDAFMKNSEVKFLNVRKVLKLKIIPPLKREFFQKSDTLERAISSASTDILSVFQPKFRNLITISRTNLKIGEKKLQVLLVVAPVEAEEDVARVKLQGIRLLNRTVFPTSEDFWEVKTFHYPKTTDIRISNLPALCDDEQIAEIMQFPEALEMGEVLREKQSTEVGQFYTGKAKITIKINDKNHEDELREWSYLRAFDSVAHWCDIPIYASIPMLHECSKCKEEKRHKYRGHHENWCRINREKRLETSNVEVQPSLPASEVTVSSSAPPIPENVESAEPNENEEMTEAIKENQDTINDGTEIDDDENNENTTSTSEDDDQMNTEHAAGKRKADSTDNSSSTKTKRKKKKRKRKNSEKLTSFSNCENV